VFKPTPLPDPVDQVRLQILDAIMSGRLRAGDRLPSEVEAAQGFNVSRAAVREALASLSQIGLITTTAGRGGGSFVNELDHTPVERNLTEAMRLLLHFDGINVSEITDARRALEGTCAQLAADRRDDEQLGEMAAVLGEAANDALSEDAWLDLDIRFHRAVVRAAHNRVLLAPLAALHRVAQPRLNQTIRSLLDRAQVNAQHHAIYTAIRERDPDSARAAVDAHVDYLEALYRKIGLLDDSAHRSESKTQPLQNTSLDDTVSGPGGMHGA
jgi:DNA-binding FadR family transcriptional regulator